MARRFHGHLPLNQGQSRSPMDNDSTSYLLPPNSIPHSPTYSYGREPPDFNDFRYNSIDSKELFHNAPVRHPNKANLTLSNRSYEVSDVENGLHHSSQQQRAQNRGNSRMYDYADPQYEELPDGRKNSVQKFPMDTTIDNRSEYQSSGGQSTTDDMAVMVRNSEKRKRMNPLYDTMAQSVPSIYNKTKQKDVAAHRQIRCLRVFVIILLILCLGSLAISIYILLNTETKNPEPSTQALQEIELLKSNYSVLEKTFSALNSILFKNTSRDALSLLIEEFQDLKENKTAEIEELKQLLQETSHKITDNEKVVMTVVANMTDWISNLNTSIQSQLLKISKMEGPRGPQGVGNLSACRYMNVTGFAVASENVPSTTSWFPSADVLQKEIVMSSACATEGGTGSNLESFVLDPDKSLVQYRCKCFGKLDKDTSTRRCVFHMILCPRIS